MAANTSIVFNAAIATTALSAASELGLLDALRRERCISLSRFCLENDLHQESVAAMAYALACFGIVLLSPDRGTVTPGEQFEAAYRERGYFMWLVNGYGELWRNWGHFCRNANRPTDPADWSFVGRHGESVAAAGHHYGEAFVDHHVDALLEEYPMHAAADLGCGSASRLIALASKCQQVRGVGIEIDPTAAEVARQNVRTATLADRVLIVVDDVRTLERRAEFGEIDLLLCFFMGHDLWPKAQCKAVMSNLRSVFPSVQRFLLCDTYRSDVEPSPTVPTFQLGFEWTHAVMGQSIPTASDWLALFEESGWRCCGVRPIDIPTSAIFDLRPV